MRLAASSAWSALPEAPTVQVQVAPTPGALPEPDIDRLVGRRAITGGPAAAPLPLLPDLQTLPPSDLAIRFQTGGGRVLRLSNAIWNSGQGPLELHGKFNPSTRKTRVHQRVYAVDGSLQERLGGEFVWHPGHEHSHFAGFALYRL